MVLVGMTLIDPQHSDSHDPTYRMAADVPQHSVLPQRSRLSRAPDYGALLENELWSIETNTEIRDRTLAANPTYLRKAPLYITANRKSTVTISAIVATTVFWSGITLRLAVFGSL